MSGLGRPNKDLERGGLLERQLLSFHYERPRLADATPLPVVEIYHRLFGPVGVAVVGTPGWLRTEMYVFERRDIGFAIRHALPEYEGKMLIAKIQGATWSQVRCLPALAELGLSYRELSQVLAVDARELRRRLASW